MWVTKLLVCPVKIRIFSPKINKFGPKLAFLVIFGQACQFIWCPVGGLVGGCGTRAVSRKTHIYFMIASCRLAIFVNMIKTIGRSKAEGTGDDDEEKDYPPMMIEVLLAQTAHKRS